MWITNWRTYSPSALDVQDYGSLKPKWRLDQLRPEICSTITRVKEVCAKEIATSEAHHQRFTRIIVNDTVAIQKHTDLITGSMLQGLFRRPYHLVFNASYSVFGEPRDVFGEPRDVFSIPTGDLLWYHHQLWRLYSNLPLGDCMP